MFDSDGGKREAMSKVDTAWLRMERPTNLMMITGVLMFAAPLVPSAIKQLLGERFLAYRRFRQKAVNTPSGAYWETDEDFDLDWHVRVAALPGAGDKIELENFVGELASSPLDHSKPLWQFHVVENYRGGSVLVARIHHCYADGLALVQVMLSLTDTAPDPEKHAELTRTWLKRDGQNVWQRMLEPAQAKLGKALKVGNKVFDKMTEMINDPSVAADVAREGGEITRELANALLLPDDPLTLLKGPLGVVKRVAWAEPLPLEEVKTLGRVLDCTVNDVLLACASGALRGYLLDQGGEVDGLTIRATVPVNLRPLEHAKKLGNHFGLVFLELPIGEANPLRRLERVAACMRELKGSRQAIVTLGLLGALGMGPQALQAPALELFSRKATTVATNVPGPQQPLYMTGVEATELMFWVPQSGSIGVGLSILSYNGTVHFGLMGDAKRVRDPDAVTRRFGEEFEKLILIALMEDWDGTIASAGAEATLRHELIG
ncbi:MAG TPA: wax ester/triacylglycerol synthase family O-acyltransferase [Dokdonella sp.]|uniref:WS/DGAT/MGAT family O-acyltransferase n=1 Tax=Dokdonella sp. TaxID=2291710 RepID=UPI002D081B1A|nr:wax ester/triacylglycerol synthase family O-acyltransferase [Dokdonella sp.]HOX70163.1 wax ester/triacylglycerol synthase family O-acyltransferase [Dokdonella sp.]HPG93546.1 wax ester/triacylglycerol synthase family O-acyltransferase [Dokdonella sp.]HPN78274.1 wax ester/triacylglycerol synthase family O-acyltransferase [Dokdonella sp.]